MVDYLVKTLFEQWTVYFFKRQYDQEGLTEVTPEQTGRSEGASLEDIWRRVFEEEGKASAKALRQEQQWVEEEQGGLWASKGGMLMKGKWLNEVPGDRKTKEGLLGHKQKL